MNALRKPLDQKHRQCPCGSYDIVEDILDAVGPNHEPRQVIVRCRCCNRATDPVYYQPNANGLNRGRAVIAARKRWNHGHG